jgi:cobalamin biosynthesis Co2+ chelatase CbiK
MELYLYSLADLQVLEKMLLEDLAKETTAHKFPEVAAIIEKLKKIDKEKRSRLASVDFVAGDDPSATKEFKTDNVQNH